MPLINCPECQREVSDSAIACPVCGFQIQQYMQKQKEIENLKNVFKCKGCGFQNEIGSDYCSKCNIRLTSYTSNKNLKKRGKFMETKKKNGGLSIAAMVLGIVGIVTSCAPLGAILSIIGLILAIVALAQKANRQGMAIAGLVTSIVGLALFLIFVLFFYDLPKKDSGSVENNYENEEVVQSPNDSEQTPLVDITEQEPEEDVDDTIIDVDISDCHIKYIKHELVQNMAGDDCIAIYYEFTNNSDEAQSFSFTTSEKAFQDGVELEGSLFHVNDESKNGDAEIKPGVTITVCSGFILRNQTSDIELEIGEWLSFDDTPDDTMTLSIQ